MKGFSMPNWRQPIKKTKVASKQLLAPVQNQRDDTRTTFGECRQPMDIERAYCKGLCFNCGRKRSLII